MQQILEQYSMPWLIAGTYAFDKDYILGTFPSDGRTGTPLVGPLAEPSFQFERSDDIFVPAYTIFFIRLGIPKVIPGGDDYRTISRSMTSSTILKLMNLFHRTSHRCRIFLSAASCSVRHR